MRLVLQFIERLLTVPSLVASSLRRGAHPLQFLTVEVIGTGYLRPTVVHTLLPLLKIITVVAAISIDRLIVKLKDDIAHMVEEIAVMGHHEQRQCGA